MWVLALDSATPRLSAALGKLDSEGGVSELQLREGAEGRGQHARRLPDLLTELCVAQGIAIQEVEAFVGGLGPGSFTGLRTGLATLKALAFGLHRPLIGVSSLSALARAGAVVAEGAEQAAQGKPSEAIYFPCLDARRGELYVGSFDAKGAACGPLLEVAPLAPEALLEALASSPPAIAFGNAGGHARVLEAACWRPSLPSVPSAAELLRLAAGRLLKGEDDEPRLLLPSYKRRSEAERKLLAGELHLPKVVRRDPL